MKRGAKAKDLQFIININNCHICTSHKPNGDGYPYLTKNKKHWRVSRYVYTNTFGEIPNNLIIRHTCDERLCINPKHLILGTKGDNNKDRADRNRNRNQNGENNNISKLTNEEVIEIFYSKDTKENIIIKYNISRSTINTIKRKAVWKHITEKL